jgi:hypothetical protein
MNKGWIQRQTMALFRRIFFRGITVALAGLVVAVPTQANEPFSAKIDGMGLRISGPGNAATLEARLLKKSDLEILVEPNNEKEDLTLRVDLPSSGPRTWPAERVQVLDAKNLPLPVSRSGIDWHGLEFTVPPVKAVYFVRADTPDPSGSTRQPAPKMANTETGYSAKVSRWYHGKRAALSLRFDDSHPTHLSVVVPELDRYGFRGTFMINPGRSGFQGRRNEWEAVATAGRHELANHTMHHRGARTDAELEQEIGDASNYILGLTHQRSRLIALNIGGGTTITTRLPLQYFLDKYDVFPVFASLGMDDVYGNRAAAFRRHLTSHIERGLWCKAHFHSVGKGEASSDENFAAALEVVKELEPDIWITGLADAFKYQEERKSSRVYIVSSTTDEVTIRFSCRMRPDLYDHPLTVEVELPETWKDNLVKVSQSGLDVVRNFNPLVTRIENGLRFDVPPLDATYLIRRQRGQ